MPPARVSSTRRACASTAGAMRSSRTWALVDEPATRTTVCELRHLLERHGLADELFERSTNIYTTTA